MLFWKELGSCEKQEVAIGELLFALAIKIVRFSRLYESDTDGSCDLESCGAPQKRGPQCNSTPGCLDQ